MSFVEKKIISSVSFRKYKDLDKVAVNIDTLFNFNFFANLRLRCYLIQL